MASSHDKVVRRRLLRRRPLLTVVICTIASVWGPSLHAKAQEVGHPDGMMATSADSTLWSLERSRSATAPYLTLSMADNENPVPGSVFQARAEPSQRSAVDTTPLDGPGASAERSERRQSAPLVLSSSADRGPIGEELVPESWLKQSSHNSYSLLHDGLADDSFLYKDQVNYLSAPSVLTDDESSMSEPGQAPSAILELKIGGLDLPVMLSSARGWQ
jgi:hypothetical protein